MKIFSNFYTDKYLMFLIQDVTKKDTHEILGFFYDLGQRALDIGIKDMKGRQRSIKRSIEGFFPDSSIPFCMTITGQKRLGFSSNNSKADIFEGEITVKFPELPNYVDNTKLTDMLMEASLLGGAVMPLFEQPATRSSKSYQKLMKEICENQEKKRMKPL